MRGILPVPDTVGPVGAAPALRPLEIAHGVVFGMEPAVRRAALAEVADVPAELDRVMRAALSRPPCFISFSGGRDSSALLAWATRLARREQLSMPVPATLVVPGDSDAEESSWQRQVLDHLGLSERIEFQVGSELDVVGEVATTALSRHGLLWPFNTHMHLPIIAAAQGGSLITGFGGDELARSSRTALAAQALTGQRRLARTDPAVIAFALSPPFLRRAVYRRRNRPDVATMGWLTTEAARALRRALAVDDAAVSLSWADTVTDWFDAQRYFRVCAGSFAALGAAYDVRVHHPFVDQRVRVALAAQGGMAGFGTRTELMRAIFGDVLPASIVERQSKASFSNVLHTDVAREFARSWSGAGLDEELVDVGALRQHWLGPAVDMRSLTLLQAAWRHDHGLSGGKAHAREPASRNHVRPNRADGSAV